MLQSDGSSSSFGSHCLRLSPISDHQNLCRVHHVCQAFRSVKQSFIPVPVVAGRVHLVCQAFRTVSHAELHPSPCCCRSCSSCVSSVPQSQSSRASSQSLLLQVVFILSVKRSAPSVTQSFIPVPVVAGRVHLVCQAFRTVSQAELHPSPCCCRSCSSCVSSVPLSQSSRASSQSLLLQVLQPGWRPVARGGGLGGADPLQAGVGVWRGQDGPSLRDGRGLPLLLPPLPLQRHPGSVRLPLPAAPAAGSAGGRGPGERGPAREEGQQRGGGREGYTRHPHGLPPPLLVTAIPQDSTVARDPSAHSGPWGRQQQQQ